jgi:hypothetical protein
VVLGNYALAAGSPAINYDSLAASSATFAAAPANDFFDNPRKGNSAVDAGAVEFAAGPAAPVLSLAPASLTFNTPVTTPPTTSASQTLTLSNTGTAAATGITVTVPAPFSRQGGSCGATLAAGANCSITVVFTPTAVGQVVANATVTANAGATASALLTGNGTAVGQLSFTSATNGTLGTLLGLRTLTFTIPTPRASVTSVVTITNTGSAPVNITAETITVNPALFSVSANTCSFTTPLAAGGTCTVSVRYATPTTRPILPNIGTLGVANNGIGTIGGNTPLLLFAQ